MPITVVDELLSRFHSCGNTRRLYTISRRNYIAVLLCPPPFKRLISVSFEYFLELAYNILFTRITYTLSIPQLTFVLLNPYNIL